MLRRALIAVVAATTLAVSGCTAGHHAAGGAGGGMDLSIGTTLYPPDNRQPVPPVTGTLLDGATFDFAKQHGHVIVVNFWGSWCGPCRAETGDLESVHTASAARGVVFVGVNIRDEQDAATSYIDARHVTYPSIFDPAGRVLLAFDAVPPSAIPSTLVIDATGKIASIHIGAITSTELTGMIAQASR